MVRTATIFIAFTILIGFLYCSGSDKWDERRGVLWGTV